MYLFVAYYVNMDTDEEISRSIEIESQLFDTEKEIYVYAMSRAYNLKQKNECFERLEFISC